MSLHHSHASDFYAWNDAYSSSFSRLWNQPGYVRDVMVFKQGVALAYSLHKEKKMRKKSSRFGGVVCAYVYLCILTESNLDRLIVWVRGSSDNSCWLRVSETPVSEGKAFSQWIESWTTDLTMSFVHRLYGVAWQLHLMRSLTVRMGRSIHRHVLQLRK